MKTRLWVVGTVAVLLTINLIVLAKILG